MRIDSIVRAFERNALAMRPARAKNMYITCLHFHEMTVPLNANLARFFH